MVVVNVQNIFRNVCLACSHKISERSLLLVCSQSFFACWHKILYLLCCFCITLHYIVASVFVMFLYLRYKMPPRLCFVTAVHRLLMFSDAVLVCARTGER